MNKKCLHPFLAAYIERVRKEKKRTIEELCTDAHISTKTYACIKKGRM